MKHGTQKIITVKDVPANDFIRAFSQHLKKTQKIEIPKVPLPSLYSLLTFSWSGSIMLKQVARENWLPTIRTGSISEQVRGFLWERSDDF